MYVIKYVVTLIVGGLVVIGLSPWIYPPPRRPSHSDITTQLISIRDTGDLVALTARFKTIEEWETKSSSTYKGKKMLLVVDCEMDYKFPLEDLDVRHNQDDDTYLLLLPPCFVDCDIKDIHIYDEQPGKKFGAIPIGITTKQRNAAIRNARNAAMKSAMESKADLISRAEASAERTLATICQGLGLETNQYSIIATPESGAEVKPNEKTIEDLVDQKINDAAASK